MSKIYPAFWTISCDMLWKMTKWFRAGGWVNWKKWMTIWYFMKPLSPSDGFIMNCISQKAQFWRFLWSSMYWFILDIIFKLERHGYSKCFVVLCGFDGMFLPDWVIISIPIIKCCWLNIFYRCRRVKTIDVETEALFIACPLLKLSFQCPGSFNWYWNSFVSLAFPIHIGLWHYTFSSC